MLYLGQRWKFLANNGNFSYIVEISQIYPQVNGICKQVFGKNGDDDPEINECIYSLWLDPKGSMCQHDSMDGTWEYLPGQDMI